VTWFQCVLTAVILWALGEAGKGAEPSSFFAQFPPAAYEWPVARRLLSLALCFVGMITFNNLSLKYVEVSFYNVARSLTIVFNVVLTFAVLGETTSWATLGTLAVVVAGFFLGSASEARFSLLGSAFGLTSSLFVALNGIWTKKGMAVVDGNQWRLSFYNNVTASMLFLPLIALSGEGAIIARDAHLLASARFWGVMLVGGVFGFLIGIVTILQIKFTSPLTHNISGTAKACVQTVLALYIWGNPTNAANLAGTALVLLGSCAYTYVRNGEMEAARAAAKVKAPAEAPETPTAAPDAGKPGADLEAAETAQLITAASKDGANRRTK
jgi:GDP-fucose transporter C1